MFVQEKHSVCVVWDNPRFQALTRGLGEPTVYDIL